MTGFRINPINIANQAETDAQTGITNANNALNQAYKAQGLAQYYSILNRSTNSNLLATNQANSGSGGNTTGFGNYGSSVLSLDSVDGGLLNNNCIKWVTPGVSGNEGGEFSLTGLSASTQYTIYAFLKGTGTVALKTYGLPSDSPSLGTGSTLTLNPNVYQPASITVTTGGSNNGIDCYISTNGVTQVATILQGAAILRAGAI